MASKSRGGRQIPLWGIFLLFLGVVFLLQTTGIVSWRTWSNLSRFWPVLIIIAGLYLLLRHSHPWFATIIILSLLFGSLGLAIWQYSPGAPGSSSSSYSRPLAGLQQARIEMRFAAGRLSVGSLPAGSPNLVEGSGLNGAGIVADFSTKDGQGAIDLSREKGSGGINAGARWQVRLTRNIPLTLVISSSASQSEVNLGEINVADLSLDTNVGSLQVTMPPSSSRARIRANLSSVDVVIPAGSAARIKADSKLGAIEIDQRRFPRSGDYFASADFATARNRIDLEIECNLGRITVR